MRVQSDAMKFLRRYYTFYAIILVGLIYSIISIRGYVLPSFVDNTDFTSKDKSPLKINVGLEPQEFFEERHFVIWKLYQFSFPKDQVKDFADERNKLIQELHEAIIKTTDLTDQEVSRVLLWKLAINEQIKIYEEKLNKIKRARGFNSD